MPGSLLAALLSPSPTPPAPDDRPRCDDDCRHRPPRQRRADAEKQAAVLYASELVATSLRRDDARPSARHHARPQRQRKATGPRSHAAARSSSRTTTTPPISRPQRPLLLEGSVRDVRGEELKRGDRRQGDMSVRQPGSRSLGGQSLIRTLRARRRDRRAATWRLPRPTRRSAWAPTPAARSADRRPRTASSAEAGPAAQRSGIIPLSLTFDAGPMARSVRRAIAPAS